MYANAVDEDQLSINMEGKDTRGLLDRLHFSWHRTSIGMGISTPHIIHRNPGVSLIVFIALYSTLQTLSFRYSRETIHRFWVNSFTPQESQSRQP